MYDLVNCIAPLVRFPLNQRISLNGIAGSEASMVEAFAGFIVQRS